MTLTQQIITIGLCALGTMLTRFLPFYIFNENKKTPAFVQYLGRVLPGAIFATLVVYCLKSVSLRQYSYGHFRDGRPASLEAADAPFDRGRHDRLYASHPLCLLSILSSGIRLPEDIFYLYKECGGTPLENCPQLCYDYCV